MNEPKLPDRFVGHGVIGRGGQAVVVLATDTLRGERVALKVVHPHLAADPATRRRLQREVRAASLLHSDAALVPYDLHEVEGTVALSMPFHPGQTVAERVGAEGSLPADDVRAIGVRVARALADAHAAGILHRDVSATNVLTGTDPARDTVLADFGLARVIGQTATATRAAGTLGYAAPEVLASGRADARSDLYGLGAVLFIAATGRTVMDARQPLRDLRPDLPDDLRSTIEALLARDPADRPQSATEVLDALEQRLPATSPAAPEAPSPAPIVAPRSGRYFPEGSAAVWVREGEADRERRKALRRKARGEHRPSPVDEITRWGTHVAGKVREALGIPAPDPTSPEERLVGALEQEAGLPAGALLQSPQLLLPGFVLIEGIDRSTADRLADAAASAGFHAEVREGGALENRLRRVLPVLIATVVAMVGMGLVHAEPWTLVALVALAVVATNAVLRGRRERHVVPAYEPTLSGALRPGVVTAAPRPAASTQQAPRPRAEPQPESRGQALRRRAELALDALEGVDDLPEPALVDVRATAKDLRRQAGELAAHVDRLEQAAAAHGASDAEIAALTGRLARLRALQAAGDPQDPGAIVALEKALAQHEADRAAAEEVESELASTTARLLGIASTASRVRRELVAGGPERTSVSEGLDRLHAQARAAQAARRETR